MAWRIFTFVVVAAVVLAALATYQVAWGVEFVQSCGPTSGNSAGPSVSCTVGTGEFLVVTLYMESPQTVTARTWNGTEELDYQTTFAPQGESTEYRVYYLAGATAGSYDVDFTLSGSTPWSLSADVYTAVSASAPFFDDDAQGCSGCTSVTTSVSPAAGRTSDWMVCGGASGNAGYNVQSGATERQQLLNHASEYARWSDSNAAISGATTVTHESTGGSNNLGAWCAVLQSDGSGATPTPSPGATIDLTDTNERLEIIALSFSVLIFLASARFAYLILAHR